MRGFKRVATIVQTLPWTCCRCLHVSRSSIRRTAGYTAKIADTGFPHARKRTIIAAAIGGTVSAGVIVTLSDDLKHGYAAARRTGRVLATLAVCINE